MRVILAHKYFRYLGGAEAFFFETGRVLKQNGHEVAYFSTVAEDNIESEFSSFFVEPPEYVNGSLIKRSLGIGRMVYSSIAKNKFAALISEFKPDLIHVFAIHIHLSPSILEAAKEAGIPIVMSCNDYKHICPNYKLYDGKELCESCQGGKFYNAIIKRCCKDSLVYSVASAIEAYVHEHLKVYDKLVSRYLFASEFMLNKTKEFWPDKHVEYGVLKNPFDPSKYHPVYEGSCALYFGRIIDIKGVDHIIEAAKRIDVPIKIVGDGPDMAKLQEEVMRHKLSHVEFLGEIWGEELNEVLYEARFVIVPSLWYENFPYVIFQAFAAGKPVLGSNRGGIPELIGKDRGILFEPNNSEELADGMINLWNDIDGCQRMGKLSREYVEKEFTNEKFYNSLIKHYQDVLQ
jgi:glycosyltransferase involved in cell wall biosynthesis